MAWHGMVLRRIQVIVNLVEPTIQRRRPFKLVVGANRFDVTAVQQDNAIGNLNGSQVVRNQERGSALAKFFDGLADQELILNIDGARGLVEDEDGGVAQHARASAIR